MCGQGAARTCAKPSRSATSKAERSVRPGTRLCASVACKMANLQSAGYQPAPHYDSSAFELEWVGKVQCRVRFWAVQLSKIGRIACTSKFADSR